MLIILVTNKTSAIYLNKFQPPPVERRIFRQVVPHQIRMRRRHADEFIHHFRIGVRKKPPNYSAQIMADYRDAFSADGN